MSCPELLQTWVIAAEFMPQTLPPSTAGLVAPRVSTGSRAQSEDNAQATKGFGGSGQSRSSRRKGGRKRSPALSKADWGPLGKHPDREAIVARQRLHLPLAGRISAEAVNRAWKGAAAEHHPDRGGNHDTMQRVNGARDLLLGRTDP